MDNRRYDNRERQSSHKVYYERDTSRNIFDVPATEKTIVVQAMNFYRLADDQIIEEFTQTKMSSQI